MAMRPTMVKPAPNLPPRAITDDTCIRCGRRMLVTRSKEGRVMRAVHENGFLRCEPPAAHTCDVCRTDAMYQCSTSTCTALAHPSCLMPCSCCSSVLCPTHALEVDGAIVCEACAHIPPIQERHV